MTTLDVEVSVGARLASIRQARPTMAQQDLADAVGVNRMTIHRWEVNATRVPEDRLPALATALRVSQETITRRRGEAGDVCALMVQAGAVVEQPPAPLGADSLGCVCMVLRFELFARLQSRIAVVCAPVIGQHQIKRVLAALPELGLIHHLIFVSEEAPDRSAGWELKRAEPFPELHLLRRAELESHLFSLAALARATAALAETLPSSELEPRLVLSIGDDEPRPIQSALWCWLCESESPYHLVLVGGPGSGKTVSARRFAVALAKAFLDAPEMRPCPVYVQLSSLIDATDLRMRLTQEIRMQLGIQSRAPVERALETGRLVLILDGYDELVGRNPGRLYTLERALKALLRLPCRTLMTARTPLFFAYDGQFGPSGHDGVAGWPVRTATILPLEPQRVIAHLARLPDGGRAMLNLIRENKLMELATNPYVLDILFEGAPLYVRPFLDGQPVLCNLLARRYHQWLQDDSGHFQQSSDQLRWLLGGLAAALRRAGRVQGYRDDLSADLREALYPSSAEGQLAMAPRRSRFLIVESGSFQFVHRRMEEFFFATWVADRLRARDAEALRSHWIDRHDLTLLSGMLRDRMVVGALLDWASDPYADNDLRELSLYLLPFSGEREKVLETLVRLQAMAETQHLLETVRFGLAALGDQAELRRCVGVAQGEASGRDQRGAWIQLLLLGLHEGLITPLAQRLVRETLLALDRDVLQTEIAEVARSSSESVTSRAAALVALGYLGLPRSSSVIQEQLDGLMLCDVSGHSSALLRLTMAARLALDLVGMNRFPQLSLRAG